MFYRYNTISKYEIFFPKLIPLIYVKVNVEKRLSALKILVCSQEYYGAKKTLDVN